MTIEFEGLQQNDINLLDPLSRADTVARLLSTPIKWTHILVHHTGAEEKDTDQIRRDHIRRGFQDVGYHYVDESDGKLVEGRAITLPGAHCPGYNFKALGVALIGNFEKRPPHPAQIETLSRLLVRLMAKHNIPATNVLGHGSVAATACPGKLFNRLHLKPVRLEVNDRVSPGLVELTDGRSYLVTEEGHRVFIPGLIRQLGGSTRWSEATRAVVARIW